MTDRSNVIPFERKPDPEHEKCCDCGRAACDYLACAGCGARMCEKCCEAQLGFCETCDADEV